MYADTLDNAPPKVAALTLTALAALALFTMTAAADDRVFVPMGGDNQVLVVDGETNRVIDRIKDTPAAHGLGGTADGRYLIAGSFDERAPGTTMPSRPAGVSAKDHAAHHGGGAKHGGPDTAISTVTVIDAKTLTPIRKIDVPGGVHHVATSPDSRFAAVTHPNQGAVSVIDLKTFRTTATVKTGAVPNYAAFSTDGRKLFVSNGGGNTVSVIDTGKWTVSRRITTGQAPEHIVASPDGNRLYVNNTGDGTVSVVDLAQGRTVRTLTVGEDPHGIDLSDDGKTLFVSVRGEDRLVAIDLATGAKRTLKIGPEPYHLAAIRGHGVLYVSSADTPDLWVVDQKTLEKRATLGIGGKGHQMVQLPGPMGRHMTR